MLRAEAEDEFRQMCLEFPWFSFDVISKSIPDERRWVVGWELTGFSSTLGLEGEQRAYGEAIV